MRKAWAYLVALWRVILPSRFSAFLIVIAGVLLAFTDQGKELAVGLAEAPSLAVVFVLVVLWWAFQSWHWARVALNDAFGSRRADWDRQQIGGVRVGGLLHFLPRIYAWAIFVLAAGALVRSGVGGWFYPLLLGLGAGGVFFTLLIFRTRIGDWIQGSARINTHMPQIKTMLTAKPDAARGFAWLKGLAPLSRWVLLFSVLLAAGLGIWACADAIDMGRLLGPTSIAFLAFATIVPVGSALVIWSHRAGVPVITCVALWVVVWSWANDNHEVRSIIENGKSVAAPERADFADQLTRWKEANAADGRDPEVVVFVSAAGGGLRAAYWTATVLGRLQDCDPTFARKIFSISGVSGGSLGAAVFNSIAAEEGAAPAPQQAAVGSDRCVDAPVGRFQKLAGTVLSNDFLGPTLAGLFYPDLMQRFVPFPVFPDRAKALEQSWERAWESACTDESAKAFCRNKDRFAGPFGGLWAHSRAGSAGWLPILLLNGTHQETGKRVITSNLPVTTDVFADAFDFYHLVQHEVRVSTAVLNSARFPYVTPSGSLVDHSDDEQGSRNGHILDGGYFENYGAETTREVAMFFSRQFSSLGGAAPAGIRMLFVEITSDPDLSEGDAARDDPAPAENPADRFKTFADEKSVRRFANEFLAPLDGFAATRQARGVFGAKRLARYAEPGNIFHFQLCRVEDAAKPPLGWAMTARSRETIDNLLMGMAPDGSGPRQNLSVCEKRNMEKLDELIETTRTP